MSFPVLILAVLALNAYAFLLLFARAWLYGAKVYRPMVLTFFLSAAPIFVLIVTVLAVAIASNFTITSNLSVTWVPYVVGGIGMLCWLLLLPNSGYLITELNLNHRKPSEKVPLWFDIVAVLSLAMSGVVNTVINVFLVQLVFAAMRDTSEGSLVEDGVLNAGTLWLSGALIVLVAVGMYLGRYLRFNSWDIRHPKSLFTKTATHFRERGSIKNFIVFTITHALFIALMYSLIVLPELMYLMSTK